MDKVKEVIAENKVLLIMLFVIIAIFITFYLIDYIDGKKIYNSDVYSNKTVPYLEKKYDDNEYKVMIMDELDMVQLYYKDYLNKMINNPKEAWNITFQDGEYSSIDFDKKYDDFTNKVKKRITKNSVKNVVEKYKYKNELNYNIITIIDSENYMYEIYEYGVWEYKVAFKGQVSN